MSAITEATRHYLVVDVLDGLPIYVFLTSDPGPNGPLAEEVHLEPIPANDRFGRPGRPAVGRPVLGQARGSRTRFREFASSEDLWEAGFLPVAQYRLCDTWADYHSPWGTIVMEQGDTVGRADPST
jgi:hypothetical protein